MVNQKKSRILVNALSAQLGGGQTYLLNLFDPSLEVWKDVEIIFLTTQNNDHVFKKQFGNTHCIGLIGNNFFSRVFWENFFLKGLVNGLGIDLVFLPGGLAPFIVTLPQPIVSVSQNMLPFDWQQIRNSSMGQKFRLILLRFLQSHTFKNSNKVIFLSNFAREKICGLLSLNLDSRVIPHGINESFFKKSDTKIISFKYFLYVSTFFEYKHQIEVLKAFEAFLKKTSSDTKLVFVGNNQGPYGSKVKALCEELGLLDKVIFKGNVPYQEIPSMMQHSSLNIFASDCENCPNILLEYMASGPLIVSSNFEPMKEFGDGFVNFFNPNFPEELTNLMLNGQSEKKIVDIDRDFIRKTFSWKKTAMETKALMNEVLS